MAKSKKQVTPEEWWSTSIIEIQPGVIRYRSYAIEELIEAVGFADMIWLLTRGEPPEPAQAKLLEAALVAAVDHDLNVFDGLHFLNEHVSKHS